MSTELTRDNDYQFPPYPFPADLGREEWNGTMLDLSSRLRSVEGLSIEYQATVDLLRETAVELIATSLTPDIEAQRLKLDELQTTTDELQALISDALAENFLASAVPLAATIEGVTATHVQQALTVMRAQTKALETINANRREINFASVFFAGQ